VFHYRNLMSNEWTRTFANGYGLLWLVTSSSRPLNDNKSILLKRVSAKKHRTCSPWWIPFTPHSRLSPARVSGTYHKRYHHHRQARRILSVQVQPYLCSFGSRMCSTRRTVVQSEIHMWSV